MTIEEGSPLVESQNTPIIPSTQIPQRNGLIQWIADRLANSGPYFGSVGEIRRRGKRVNPNARNGS